MNRNTVATMTVTALLASGCSAAKTSFDGPLEASQPAVEVQLGSLSADLPPLVQAMVANSVEINGVLQPKEINHKTFRFAEWGQGVRLGPDVVATAGHAVIDGNGKNIDSLSAKCGNLTVRTPTTVPTSYHQGRPLYGTALPVEGYTAQRGPAGNALRTPDLALLRIRGSQQTPAVRPVMLAPSKLTPGADLYSINYEPTADVQERSPSQASLTEIAVARGLSKPAIFGMVALARQADQLIEAVDTQHSYGVQQESKSREGASGSPVYNREGQLVGLIVQEFENLTAKQLTEQTGFRFAGRIAGKFDEILIQPVTPHLLQTFTHGLPTTGTC